jgi:putative endonuclease
MKLYYVYILASINRVLYTGITGNLEQRLIQHRHSTDQNAFAVKYRCNRLVYVEEFTRAVDALAREKQIKGYRRDKKIALIKRLNPDWQDLAPPALPGPSLRSG